MDFLRTVPRTLPSYYHAVARHSRLPKPLALLASLLVYSEGGREGAGCVWVSTCQRQLIFLRRPRHVLNNASSTRIDPLAIDCATPRDQRDPTPSEPMRHTPTMWENHLPRSRSDLGTETSERVWGARPCSLVLVLTRITCLAASCSVRGRMRGDQAQGRGAILGSQQQPRSPGRRMALNFPTRHAHRTCEMPLKPGRKGRGKKSFRHQPRVSGLA